MRLKFFILFLLVGLFCATSIFAQENNPQKKIILSKKNFKSNEEVSLNIEKYNPHNLEVVVKNKEDKNAPFDPVISDHQIKLKPQKNVPPGTYKIFIKDKDKILFEQDFTWGVLAINFNKSTYLPNEKVNLSFAVLDENGQMVCDAELKLLITNPETNIKEELSTANDGIKINPECFMRSFTLIPDYSSEYTADKVGFYSLELIAKTKNGEYSINDSFEVKESVDFDIYRNSATRIYPPLKYPVTAKIIANKNFEGEIQESVPVEFKIYSSSGSADFSSIEVRSDKKIIKWNVNLKSGQEINIGYEYLAPNLSPQLYFLGPLSFIEHQKIIEEPIIYSPDSFEVVKDINGEVIRVIPKLPDTLPENSNELNNIIKTKSVEIFNENRQWQIAADATETYTTSGQWVVPDGVSTLTVEVWGGGGAGGKGGSTNGDGGGGGAGGQYAKKTITVSSGSTYAYTVGLGGTATSSNGGNGLDSSFAIIGAGTTYALAKGGAGGRAYSGSSGIGGTGSVVAGIGDTIYKGGNGGSGTGSLSGGGGGGPGTTGNGNNASGKTPGAAKLENGGIGGSGTSANSGNGLNGNVYSAGGGGATRSGAPGGGAQGLIVLNYSISNQAPGIPDLVFPDIGATNQSITPTFTTIADDINNDVLQYEIKYCTNSGMSVGCTTVTAANIGWSGADVGTSSYSAGTTAAYVLQVGSSLAENQTIYWKTRAIDPAGSNTWSGTQTTPFSFTTGQRPNIPVLVSPDTGATAVSLTPTLRTVATDPDSDNLQYKIQLCLNSAMSVGCTIYDITSSAVGWSGMNVGTSAFSAGTTAAYIIQSNLDVGTTFYWRSYALDYDGLDRWSNTQASPNYFVTRLPAPVFTEASFRWSNDDGGEIHGGGGSWYNENWTYRQPLTITNQTASTLTNFQVGITFPTDSLYSSGKIQLDCDDLRFTLDDHSTLIDYWIESGCNTSSTKVWLKIPQLSASSSETVYMYYGNSVAPVYSSGDNTFIFFDDFNDATLDTSKWNDYNPDGIGTVNIGGGTLAVSLSSSSAAGQRGIISVNTMAANGTIFETRTQWALNAQSTTSRYTNWKNFVSDIGNPTNICNADSFSGSGNQYMWGYQKYKGLFSTTHGFTHDKCVNGTFTGLSPGNSTSMDVSVNLNFIKWSWYNTSYLDYKMSYLGIGWTNIQTLSDTTMTLPKNVYFGSLLHNNTTGTGVHYLWLDWARVRQYISTEPAFSFDSEENSSASSGTTWMANENVGITSVPKNINLRLRFSINNSGDSGNANFKLQVAPKGGQSNCESVASGNFSDVPTTAGSSVGIMSTSPNFTNQESTTNQLTASAATFVAGKMVEHPSNQSDSVTLVQDEFTEIEYNFQLTNNAASNTSYCFRAINSTTPFNTYTKVAELTTVESAVNQAPHNPTNLSQKKVDDSAISIGQWINSSSIKFSVGASDPDIGNTLYLCIEKKDISTSFSNVEDSCGSGLTYSGVGITLTHTISGIGESAYHWQARVKDQDGLYSSWVTFGANPESSRDFGIDTSSPVGGAVYDGLVPAIDKTFNDGSLSTLSANWSGIDNTISGLNYYQYSVGTSQGQTDIKTWTTVGTDTSATVTNLSLQTSSKYYFNLQSVDNAGNTQTPIFSDGQFVSPSLSFSINPTSLVFPNVNAANNFTVGDTTTLITSTNAYNGYEIRAYVTNNLSSIENPALTIPGFNGGSYSSPASWSTSTGFGYNSNDTSINGVNKFNNNPCPGGGSPPCFAPFSTSSPGDIVADHPGPIIGSLIDSEKFTIQYKIKTDSSQAAAKYFTNVIYSITAKY